MHSKAWLVNGLYTFTCLMTYFFVAGVVVAKFSLEVGRFCLNSGSALILLAASFGLLLTCEGRLI